ncbi:MAG: hypothetical protein L0219_09445 [Phycisphaerales bacterium]|nr:hypothetical protein [Phycisphaerales bacterium]
MHAELVPSSEAIKHHWTPAAVLVSFLTLLVLAGGFAAFAIGSVDLRITMVVAIVIGIAATIAANAKSQHTARGAVWLGVWLALAFLLGGAVQGLWNAPAITVPLLDAGFAAILVVVSLKFATVVSRRT